MPLLPALPIFHSSSSSKSPKLSFVTRSSTGPSFESTPPITCQPAGNPGSFQPRHAEALWSSSSARHGPAAPGAPDCGSAAPDGAAAHARNSATAHSCIDFIDLADFIELIELIALIDLIRRIGHSPRKSRLLGLGTWGPRRARQDKPSFSISSAGGPAKLALATLPM